jgi:hypothetical protein
VVGCITYAPELRVGGALIHTFTFTSVNWQSASAALPAGTQSLSLTISGDAFVEHLIVVASDPLQIPTVGWPMRLILSGGLVSGSVLAVWRRLRHRRSRPPGFRRPPRLGRELSPHDQLRREGADAGSDLHR